MEKSKNIVSVVVISYNSGLTIQETLNSVLSQSYGAENIDLVVSDDHSTDITCQVVNDWFFKHSKSFHRTVLVTSDINKGVSANINRGWRATCGTWIKAIAADDILLPNCLSDNKAFVEREKGARIVFSDLLVFKDSAQISSAIEKHHDANFFKMSYEEQLNILIYENMLIAPSAFISKDLLEEFGYADENYKMIEDYPLWLKLCKEKVDFFYMPLVTVAYRFTDSLTNSQSRIGSILYAASFYKFRKEMVWPQWKAKDILRKLDEAFDFYELRISVRVFNNKRTKAYLCLHYALFVFRPYRVLKLLNRYVGGEK